MKIFFWSFCWIIGLVQSLHGALRDISLAVLTPREAATFLTQVPKFFDVQGTQILLEVNDLPVEFVLEKGRIFYQGEPVEGDDFSLQPIGSHVPLTPFDLTLPFFHWPEHSYEGPRKILGRGAQKFRFHTPPNLSEFSYVDVWLEGRQGFPLAWNLHGKNGEILRQFRLRSVQKIHDEWQAKWMQVLLPQENRVINIRLLE